MSKISIIVPVYKVEKYIKDCLDSLLKQTFIDFELILVDDGSPDKSGKICDEFAQKDSRIKVIHKKNGGLSSARNAGLDLIIGEYVCFVDSDDIVHKKMLELLYSTLIENNAEIAVGKFETFKDNDIIDLEYDLEMFTQLITPEKLIEKAICKDDISFSVCNKMFKSSLWDEIRFREKTYYEDEDLTYRVFDKAKICILCDYKFYYYRMNFDGISHNISPKIIDQYYTRKGMYEYLKAKHLVLAPLCYASWFDVSVKIYLQYKYKLKMDMKDYFFLKEFDRTILKKVDKNYRSKPVNYYLNMPFSFMVFCVRLRSLIKRIIKKRG
jgi:glycosyltransferase involved in cell wall biosynthesis